jgi:hypothetical protein
MTYTIDLSTNALCAIGIVAFALIYVFRLTTRHRNVHDANSTAWEAWEFISNQAIANGKDIPPPPGSSKKG